MSVAYCYDCLERIRDCKCGGSNHADIFGDTAVEVEKERRKYIGGPSYISITKLEKIVDRNTDDTFKTYDADRIAEELIKLVDRTNKEEL